MNINAYLDRIDITDRIKADIDSLNRLQYNHIHSIPFEDLDIYYGVPIKLNLNSFYQKIVLGNRGGYCYELNSLFYQLLKAIGYEVYYISGRVVNGKSYGPEFGHMALMVIINNRKWLVDVGFGNFSLKPLDIDNRQLQSDGVQNYLIKDDIVVDGTKYFSVGKWNDKKKSFNPEYVFTTTIRKFEDFATMNHCQQHSQDSHFVRNLICTLPTIDGRVTVINNRLIQTQNGNKTSSVIVSGWHLQEILRRYFNVDFSIIGHYNFVK